MNNLWTSYDCLSLSRVMCQRTCLIGGFKQYIWCPRSQPSHSNICSASPLRRHILQRAFNTDLSHDTQLSRLDKWINTCAKFVDDIKDSSQRSNKVFRGFAFGFSLTSILPFSTKINVDFYMITTRMFKSKVQVKRKYFSSFNKNGLILQLPTNE